MGMRRVVGVLLVGSAVLVGCGGGDGKTKVSTATTVDGSTSGGDSGASSDGGGDASLTKASCLAAATAMAQTVSGLPGAFTGGDTGDLKDSIDAFKKFAAGAPSEIRADLKTVAEGYADFMTVFADSNYNPASGQTPSPDAMAKLTAASEKLNNSDFEAAADRVSAWFDKNCGD